MLEARTRVERSGASDHLAKCPNRTKSRCERGIPDARLSPLRMPLSHFSARIPPPQSVSVARELKKRVDNFLKEGIQDSAQLNLVLPDLNALLGLYCAELQAPILHLPRRHSLSAFNEVPNFSRYHVHASLRDKPVVD